MSDSIKRTDTDKFSKSAPIENPRPAGGYVPPTNLKPVPGRPTDK
jgi:hypothetical protein